MAGEKILIVEDDGIIAKHLEKTLSQLGYSIAATFASGEEVLESVDALNPELVLMDINLNGDLDGIQTAEILTQKLDIPIVYLTAFADKKTLKRAKVTDPFGYILKPFEIHNLQVTVELALRKHTYEKQLRDSETRFRMVVENQNDGIAIIDLQDNFTLVNPASEKLFGMDPGELIGKKLNEFISPEQCKLIREKADKSPDGEKDSIDVVVTHVDGKHRHVQVTFSPWLQAGEDRKDMFIIFHDITEQKKMQKSEREARMLAEALRDSAAALNSTLEIDEVFNQILSNLEKVVPLDAANIMLIEGEEVYIVKGIGYSKLGIEENINSIRFNLKDAPCSRR